MAIKPVAVIAAAAIADVFADLGERVARGLERRQLRRYLKRRGRAAVNVFHTQVLIVVEIAAKLFRAHREACRARRRWMI
jgi:hypothetical protein